MASPNLKSPVTVTGKVRPYAVTATLAEALANGATSNKLIRVNAIRAANISAASTGSVSVSLYRGTTHTYIIKDASLTPGRALIISDRNEPINLEEGDALYAQANSAGVIHLTINYDEFA